jgi:hypothetical protein
VQRRDRELRDELRRRSVKSTVQRVQRQLLIGRRRKCLHDRRV